MAEVQAKSPITSSVKTDLEKSVPNNRVAALDPIANETEIENQILHSPQLEKKPVVTNPFKPQEPKEKQLKDNIVIKGLSKFLDDNWWLRLTFALGNEIAESIEPSLEGLKVPKPQIHFIYRGLWSLAAFCTSNRVVMKGINEGDILSSLKVLIQDGIAAIGGPTIVARVANFLQNKVYDAIKVPEVIKNLIRPMVSLFCCFKAVVGLDPAGKWAGEKVVDFVSQNIKKKPAAATT